MTIQEFVKQDIERAAEENDIAVFYVCESGSRAWGFPSADSDYDVRFLYVHPRDWYLSIFRHRDTIEFMREFDGTDVDYVGWDIGKALLLLHNGNPNLLSWIYSPYVYYEDAVVERVRRLAADNFRPRASFHHHLSLARKHYDRYIKPHQTVSRKRYLYTLRGVLSAQLAALSVMPPIDFADLLDASPVKKRTDVLVQIAGLVSDKMFDSETDETERVPILDEYIVGEIARLRKEHIPVYRPPKEPFETLFIDIVDEYA